MIDRNFLKRSVIVEFINGFIIVIRDSLPLISYQQNAICVLICNGFSENGPDILIKLPGLDRRNGSHAEFIQTIEWTK